MNLIKGLLVAILSLYALFSALDALLHGGRSLDAGVAIKYAAIAASGCLVIALIQTAIATKILGEFENLTLSVWLPKPAFHC